MPSSPTSPGSVPGSPVGLGLGIGGLNIAEPLEEIDPDAPLPVFEVQPTMVAVDLTLGPGESRTCKFFSYVANYIYLWNTVVQIHIH